MIEACNLSKCYGELRALCDVSFQIPSGQICGYVGPNGAGKTTTVKILTGMLKPTSGSASVAGFELNGESIEIKRRIGYVPENVSMYQTLTVEEYLTFVGTIHEVEPHLIAKRKALFLRLLDIEEAETERIGALSKGMRQKVGIIGELLHEPSVLFLDEPFSGLDVNSVGVVKDLVVSLAERGTTVLFCSHLLDIVERFCERVIILNHGTMLADGSPLELMTNHNKSTLEAVFQELTSHSAAVDLTNLFDSPAE